MTEPSGPPIDIGNARFDGFEALGLDLFGRRVAHLHAHQVGQLAVFDQQLAVGQGLADGRQQIIVVPRLADEAVDADFVHRPHQGVEVGVAGENQARRIRLDGLGCLEEFDAVHDRHAVIADEQVVAFAAGCFEGSFRRGIRFHFQLEGLAAEAAWGEAEDTFERVEDGFLVVDEHDAAHFAS